MIDSKVLLKALQKQVISLEKDLTPTGLADARLKVDRAAGVEPKRVRVAGPGACKRFASLPESET